MKKLIYLITIITVLYNCKVSKGIKMENEEILIPRITKELETFNIERFYKNGSSSFKELKDDNLVVYTGDTKNSIKKLGFSEKTYPINSYFSIVKNYFPNGNIEIKGVTFNNGSEYGTWYEFNEEGVLISEENTDEGYDFDWIDIINYCIKNEITLEKGQPEKGGIKTEIYKNEKDEKKVWVISYYDSDKYEYLELTLDGKTGNQIEKRELEFEGN